ncbi:hypothetical protein ACFY8C_20885 [Streptomyces flavochromogenes]|uniref:Uncharacterized protein n=1 Tax=Streptomyces flavochromogenes TaxID=68199 RepID=A0ABW6XTE2_9ACTN|nr:hypothetical protein [Streptomyces flavochromogenes]
MAYGVYHTKYGITINLTFEDLGHPDRPGLLEEITQPVGERDRDLLQCLTDYQGGDCQCALADKTPWMFVRRQRRAGRSPGAPPYGWHSAPLGDRRRVVGDHRSRTMGEGG